MSAIDQIETESVPNGPHEACFYVVHCSKLVALAYWDQVILPHGEVAADWYLCQAVAPGHHDALGIGGGPLAEEAAAARAAAIVSDRLDRDRDWIVGFEDLPSEQLPWRLVTDT